MSLLDIEKTKEELLSNVINSCMKQNNKNVIAPFRRICNPLELSIRICNPKTINALCGDCKSPSPCLRI